MAKDADQRWRQAEGTWDRLRWARKIHAEIETGEEAAARLGMKPVTYRAYERSPKSAKHTPLDHQRAAQFAQKFKVDWTWLLTGAGTPWGEDEQRARVMRAFDSVAEDRREEVADAIERLLRAG